MADITLWKLAADIGLVLSIIYLCLRIGRSQHQADHRRQRQLEGALRDLVHEAERTSADLAQELAGRQQALEQLLGDLGALEQRVNRAVTEADESRRQLEAKIAEQAFAAQRAAAQQQPPRQPQPEPDMHSRAMRDETLYVRPGYASQRETRETFTSPQPRATYPEPASFAPGQPQPASAAHSAYASAAAQPSSRSAGLRSAVNIFGDPISPASDSPAPEAEDFTPLRKHRSLATTIEKEIDSTPGTQDVQQSLEEIYASAEELLRAGERLELVAAKTALPIEEVRMLSQLVSQTPPAEAEEAPAVISQTDDRLGVLGRTSPMRRHDRFV